MSNISPISKLKYIMNDDPQIKKELIKTIQEANLSDIQNLDEYYDFLKNMLISIPNGTKLLDDYAKKFYFIPSLSTYLRNNRIFNKWMSYFVEEYGKFFDTDESAKHIKKFFKDPKFHINDYYVPASGWKTFNQFFTRDVKPGKRPIDAMYDDRIIVSPVDGTFKEWTLIHGKEIDVKGILVKINDFLVESKYKDHFQNGVCAHLYLDLNDYHRFHVPVAGKVLEVKKIPGNVFLDVYKKDGILKEDPGEMLLIKEDRGLVILETTFGLVALIPIGMESVSSVNLLPDVDSYLYKGQMFGYFAYGGSQFAILFENPNINFTAISEKHYLQGNRIANYRGTF